MSSKIFNVKSVRERNYDTLDLGERFNELLGRPEAKFTAMLYGGSGCGKSVFALQLADYFAKHYGKVLYNSHEEINQTLSNRIQSFNIDAPKLYFGNKLDLDEMMHKIKRNYYRMVIIDSVQYMEFTEEQYKYLRETFAKRKLAIVMVSFGTKGNPTKAKDLLHASDIKAFFKDGKIDVMSSYLSKPKVKRLFSEGGTDLFSKT